ncbi:MAG: DUF4129 domain-containing protein [Pseudomonadota bacterium]
MRLALLLLVLGTTRAEPISPEGWRSLVRDAERRVTQGSPLALTSLRRLQGRQIRDPDGGVAQVDDDELERLTTQLEAALAGEGVLANALRDTSLHLSLLETEADQLVRRPPPSYSQAIRPEGELFATAVRAAPEAAEPSPLESGAQRGWARVRAWTGLALTRRGTSSAHATLFVLVGTSLAALLLALWPALRALGSARPARTRSAREAPGRPASPLGTALLAALGALVRRGRLRQPAHLTNGEVMAALPGADQALVAPAIAVHDRACYGGAAPSEAERQLVLELAARLEERP